jgi:exonuclease SbcC
MRLDRLEVRGFMRFADEPAVLELRDLPPGLISIKGENGHGKTRLLDAPLGAIFREFPSRKGELAEYATTRDAYIETLVSFDGRGQFRVRVNVDGQKRDTNALLELVQPDGTTVPIEGSDGGLKTFDAAVRKVFPPMPLLLASAFASQNRAGAFSAMSTAKRKEFFAVLLGLEHYAEMAAKAKACFGVVETTRARLVERRDLLARESADSIGDDLAARANTLQGELGAAQLRQMELRDGIQVLEVEREDVEAQALAHRAAVERQTALTQQVGALQAQIDQVAIDEASAGRAYDADHEAAVRTRDRAIQDADVAERAARKLQQTRVEAADARIDDTNQISSRADEIRAAATQKAEAEAQIAELRDRKDADQQHLEDAREQVRMRQALLADCERAERQLETVRQGTQLLTVVKFGEACAGEPACQFVTKAAADRASIPELEAAVSAGASLREGIATWTDQVARYANDVKTRSIAIAQVEARIKGLDPIARLESELAAVEAAIAGYEREKEQASLDLQARVEECTTRRTGALQVFTAVSASLLARRTEQLDALTARRTELHRQLADVQAQLATVTESLPLTQAAAERLVALDTDLAVQRAHWTANEAALARLTERRAALLQERERYAARKRQFTSVQARLRQVEDRLMLWQIYSAAFGRDGLPTLEIAAAGPTVSTLTNDLLSACYGTRFTVELVTQEPRADGKGVKETFELKVFDNEAGGDTRDIGDLSGGERVIVEEALRCGLLLYNNSRNVAPIQTCWRDETTGALDPENALRYVAMLRRLQELGGFHHVLFITHNDDAAALADTQIVVEHGQPRILADQRRAA